MHHIQNHDQVGNRALGDRLGHVVPMPTYRAVTALLLASPYTPMLWMGQEWNATSPFQYFTDHPEELGKLVTEGRREEFKGFKAFSDPETREKIPDPQAERTFRDSKLKWDEVGREPHKPILELHRALLALRKGEPALRTADRGTWAVEEAGERALVLRHAPANGAGDPLLVVVSVGDALTLELGARDVTRAPDGRRWTVALSTEERRFGGADTTRLATDGAGRVEMTAPGAVVLRAVERTAERNAR